MNCVYYILLFALVRAEDGFYSYDRFSGKKVEGQDQMKYATERCSIEVKACTPHEGSRVDGTCNTFKSPSKGAAKGPYLRILKPDYANDRDIRKNRHSEPLPSARKVSTTLQTTGRVDDKKRFTAAATSMLEFIHRDVSLLHGPRDYLQERQYCCLDAGKADPRCIPISVPKDDPYLKVTDIRCLNFSRAETFQDSGCTPEIIPPEQINFQTPVLDLSTIYGVDEKSLAKVRKGEYGLLILERRGDRYVPQNISNTPVMSNETKIAIDNSTMQNVIANIDSNTDGAASAILNNVTTDQDVCFQNMVNESICYQFGFPEAGNYNLRTTTFAIFFTREHNRIATALHKINPCWKDDRLFKVARQINVATAASIFMYELMPALLGYRNMLNYGLLSDKVEHVSMYVDDVPPLVYAEFEIAIRFFHTMLDGRIKTYTEKHHYASEFSVSETLYRQALIEQDRNFEMINRGTFYQSAAKIDDIIDPEISINFFGDLQKAHDLGAIDIQRGRDMGIRGYNDYRHICGVKPAKKFEDLLDVMEAELSLIASSHSRPNVLTILDRIITYQQKMETLKMLYKDVDDIDLLAGIISEKSIQGTHVGPTLFCIISKQLHVFRYSDRFWFERGDQYHSLSTDQLHEMRKASIAGLACDNAEGVKYIQPQAFFNVKPGNSPVPCTHIDRPDLSKWQDDTCFKHKYSHEATHVPMSYMEQAATVNFTNFFEDLLFFKTNDLPKK